MKNFIKNSLWMALLVGSSLQASQNTKSDTTTETTGSSFGGSNNQTSSENETESNTLNVTGMQGVTQTVSGNKIKASGVRMGSRGETITREEITRINQQLSESTSVVGQRDLPKNVVVAQPYGVSLEPLGKITQILRDKAFAIPTFSYGVKGFSFTPTQGTFAGKTLNVALRRTDAMSSTVEIDILRQVTGSDYKLVSRVSFELPSNMDSKDIGLVLQELRPDGTGIFKAGNQTSKITLGQEVVDVQ